MKLPILSRLAQGWEQKRIARELGVSPGSVRYWAQRVRDGLINLDDIEVTESIPDSPPEPVKHEQAPSERGRSILWSIAFDPTAAPAARVNAIDKIAEFEGWESLLAVERTLPPPLSRDELVQRTYDLLESLDPRILSDVFRRLCEQIPEIRSDLNSVVQLVEAGHKG